MEKEVREFKVDYRLDWEYSVKIDDIRKDLDAIEKLGATHVLIESGISYDCSYVTIEAVSEHLESDEEFADRLKEEERFQNEIKQRDLDQLERIKSKYGL